MNPEDHKIIKRNNKEYWYDKKTGKLRKRIYYYENGKKHTEEYILNSCYHREDGPAYQIWSENGNKDSEEYYINGNRHREDGPARSSWYENGTKEYEQYWLDNKWHSKEEYDKIIHKEKWKLI
jgi:antitoxin component YwqK of YwqJK toxin-antitoxin module